MRMIERWFPCAEVSEQSATGWGTGNSEKAIFTWFAPRPLAQAKAAVITSLLPWPSDPTEQRRLQDLVCRSLQDRDAAHDELVQELAQHYEDGAAMLDPFSGRALIPLEAARLGVRATGIDYSPVATLAGHLLADYPLRDWSKEPDLPFEGYFNNPTAPRLLQDVEFLFDEVGRRWEGAMVDFYPDYEGARPWGYLWAVTLPCQECGRRFPLTGSMLLRNPLPKKTDPGQSYRIEVDRATGTFQAVVHDGSPTSDPTLVTLKRGGKAVRGKAAVCPFCEHLHPKDVHTRLAAEGLGEDALLLAADLDEVVGKRFREPTSEEYDAIGSAIRALGDEKEFASGLSAVPDEPIPSGNNHTVRPSMYGARTYGDLCNARQTLGFVRLTRVIAQVGDQIVQAGCSHEYAAALCSFACTLVVRKLRRATRGADLGIRKDANSNRNDVGDIFTNEASIAFSYDYFEAGIGGGPGTWRSLKGDTLAALRHQVARRLGRPARILRGSATSVPLRDHSLDAVVTDPPYDNMIDYSDASDLFFVWLKRALSTTLPDFAVTAHPDGVQEKAEEIIVKGGGNAPGEHRTREHYNSGIASAFAEARRLLRHDGVVTIVFGHGDPEVWHRLLAAISAAGLYLTGSWPAKTESGGKGNAANIVTTLTMSCRPVPFGRPGGRANDVRAEVRKEVRSRVPEWERSGLALTDQLMASAGPAMEVVGRYAEVLDPAGNPLDPAEFLVLARRVVEEAAAIQVEDLPLDVFDARTRFALFWARLFGRSVAPKSEARWQALAADLNLDELRGVLHDCDKGTRLAFASEVKLDVGPTSSVIDVALAIAAAWPSGLGAAAEVLGSAGRDAADSQLFAALTYLASRVPESDPDGLAWTAIVRNRRNLGAAVRTNVATATDAARRNEDARRQSTLFDSAQGGAGE